MSSLRKQPTFGDASTGFPAKWRLRNERRNFILMTRHYPDLSNASDWLNQISYAARPIRRTTRIWVVTRHHYEILRSFLRRHLSGKPVVTAPNVGCFLRLCSEQFQYFVERYGCNSSKVSSDLSFRETIKRIRVRLHKVTYDQVRS